MKGLQSLIIALIISFSSFSQTSIVLKNSEDSLLISNALVKLIYIDGSSEKVIYEDSFLRIKPDEYPLIIKIEHYSFYSLIDTIYNDGNYEYYMDYKSKNLAEVLITSSLGNYPKQITPFRTTVIDSNMLSVTQSTNLHEALRSYVNIRISRDQSLSSSSASMMGLGGNNVKILQDGIPISGNTGQEVDISQIPLQEISKIEIVDGPMSVEYGTNAQMGLINIISKNNFTKNTLVQLNITEQSIENKYGIAEGIHNWNLYSHIPLSKRISTNISLTRNLFRGAKGLSEGRDLDWDPRILYSFNSALDYKFNRWRVRVNNRLLHDEIENLGNANGLVDPSSIDDTYKTLRNSSIVKSTYSTDDITVDGLINYSYYKRIKTSYVHKLNTGENILATYEGANDTTSLNTILARASMIKTYTDKFLIKFGFDFQNERAKGGRIANEASAESVDAAVFIISEIKINSLLLRPGLRLDYNSKYSSPGVPSLHARYNVNKTVFKASYSKGFRAPSLKEMHFDFKDVNHNIIGNSELDAESSDYSEVSISHLLNNSRNNNQIRLGVKGYLMTVENLITYSQSIDDPSVITLMNVGKYKARGLSFTTNYSYKYLTGNFQTELLSRNFYDDESGNYHTSFAFSNTNSIELLKDKLKFNLIYTYRGEEPVVLTSIGSATSTNEIGKTEAYNIIDANLQYSLSKKINTSFGIKNILDKKFIASLDSSLHSSGTEQLVSFGRSFVFQLSYNILNK